MLELAGIYAQSRLESIYAFPFFDPILEISLVYVAILVLNFAFTVNLAPLEHSLVLRAILEVDHAFSVL